MDALIEEYTGSKRVQFRLRDIYNTRQKLGETNYCDSLIVFEFTQGRSFVKRVISILVECIKMQFIFQVFRLRGINASRIGIYPELSNPIVIYELNSPAELYVEENVLPLIGNGIKGVVKLLVRKVSGVNPSIAAVGIIVRN